MKRYLLRNLITPLEAEPDLSGYVSRKLQLNPQRIASIYISRRALDARKRNALKYNFTLELTFISNPPKHPDLIELVTKPDLPLVTMNISSLHPFIIGAGPAGLFAALALVEKGFSPWIFDRGEQIKDRKTKINDFWKSGTLDPESNMQFGEGGAGTFSDGKLTARSRDKVTEIIYNRLVEFGADPVIQYDALPHLGTDKLELIITKIRQFLESKGCRFFWNHRLNDITIQDGRITSIKINNDQYEPEIVILGLGNTARDTFSLLHSKSIALENKDFAVGFRIEHSQDYINSTFYGDKTDFFLTGPATYRLVRNVQDRGIFSFCMCPGGQVVNSASEPGGVVTNGMSNSKRSSKFANSAIVAGVSPADYGTELFAGMKFQQNIEIKAFRKGFSAPSQSVSDFVNGTKSSVMQKTTFLPGTYTSSISDLFPSKLSQALKIALSHWEKQYPGFVKEGTLIAPETRTSSPLRILRDNSTRSSINVANLFPIGEGAGYAGGIISSAADGWKTGSSFLLRTSSDI
ncbi:MAG: NAD(P)/FAD-dependent oxidoreductase [Candidatus Cloacimonetes bacterium]|nr:NAD(P)/FAD-dependent oxidoreductase [Candidatus Cloacimonadota bacterium]